MKLKNVLSFMISLALTLAFLIVVWKFADTDMAKTIVSAFLTVATSVIGFFIGYQTNKNGGDKK